MRKYAFATIAIILIALIAGPASATYNTVSEPFNSSMDGWGINVWNSAGGGSGSCAWNSTSGNPGGAVHFEGYGATDSSSHDTREGAYIDKIISTVGVDQIQVAFDLKTHLVGGAWGADSGTIKTDHADLAEQLTVFYSTDGGTNWIEAQWIRRGGSATYAPGGNPDDSATLSPTPMETYNLGYGTRIINLSGVTAANNNANFMVRLRFQFNEGTDSSNGADTADVDNIRVIGHNTGTPADNIPPSGVTGFTGVAHDGFYNTLSWTAPGDSDYAGTMIRYRTDHYPTGPDDGTFLTEVWAPGAATATHAGVTAGITYYYAAFAHDYVPNYSAAATTSVVGSSNLWTDGFESPYTLGNLNANSGGVWSLLSGDANNSQIVVGNAYASAGAQSAQIAHVGNSNADGFSTRAFNYTPANGIAKFHTKFRSPTATQNGNTFWFLYLSDTLGQPYAQWYGADSWAAPRDGNSGSVVGATISPLDKDTWYDLDMIVDTYNQKVYCYENSLLAFSGTYPSNRVGTIGQVRLRDYGHTGGAFTSNVYFDEMSVGQGVNPAPVITAPTGGNWVGTTTPTVYWTFGTSQTTDKYAVKVFTSDVADPENTTALWSSGEVTATNATSATVTSALPENTHLWAFVKLHTSLTWNPWSPQGAGGFFIGATVPPAPTVIHPVDATTVVGCKPMVDFSGGAHQSFTVKITSGSPETIAWTSGVVAGNGFGAPCAAMLTPGTSYKAYALVHNPAGDSPWSGAHAFQVSRTNEELDIRNMSEADLLTTNSYSPTDMFNYSINQQGSQETMWPEDTVTATKSAFVCNNGVLQVVDAGHGSGTRLMRRHRLAGLDLNKGVTLAMAVAVRDQNGADIGGQRWLQSTSLVCDADGAGGPWLAGLRVYQEGVGLLTDNSNDWQRATLPTSADYRILRLTGRNAVYNDYTSTVWNLYVNENPTPVVTATGCMNGLAIDPEFHSSWMNNCMTLGQGSGGLAGTWEFDWTAVNTDGDYAPGQWSGGSQTMGSVTSTATIGGSYTSIGAAKSANVQAHAVSITNPSVITMVAMDGAPAAQIGYFAQDIASGFNSFGVRIKDATTVVNPGDQITSLSGVMSEDPATGRTITSPAVTISGTADVIPVGMSQKTLMCPCIGQGLGTRQDTVGMLVRIFGRVTLSNIDYSLFGGVGGYIFYVDDGSGAVDGRELTDGVPVTGIRFVVRADDPVFPGASIGDYMMVEGISAYELATLPDASTANVRQILYPTFDIVGSAGPQ